jgi:hypothetical protein
VGRRAGGGEAGPADPAADYAVGEVRAIRTFRLGRDGGLYPLYTDRAWAPGANTARCKRRSHSAPDPGCRCGFYAYGDPLWTVAQPPSRSVLAVVALWGGLEVATRGVRAEHGRIEALWLHRRVRQEVVVAVQRRYPAARVYRDRKQLLANHRLTALAGYTPPRLTGRARQLVIVAAAVLIAVVLLVGALPARQVITSPGTALLWSAVTGAVCLTVLAGLAQRSAAVVTAGVVGLGWMVSAAGANTLGGVWLKRIPLLLAAEGCASVWWALGAVDRQVPRRRRAVLRKAAVRLRILPS